MYVSSITNIICIQKYIYSTKWSTKILQCPRFKISLPRIGAAIAPDYSTHTRITGACTAGARK